MTTRLYRYLAETRSEATRALTDLRPVTEGLDSVWEKVGNRVRVTRAGTVTYLALSQPAGPHDEGANAVGVDLLVDELDSGAVGLAWDLLLFLHVAMPRPVWLSAETFPLDVLSAYPSAQVHFIDGQAGTVLDATEVGALLPG